MPDKKLTDSEIVKALEICSTYKGKCTDCPAFVKVDRSNCKKVLLGAVEIINRLQAENEKWQGGYMTQKQEIANLEIEFKAILTKSLKDYDELISDISAEAYTDFAESLKKDFDNPHIQKFGLDFVKFLKNVVDNRLKELVGDDNA